MGQPGLTSDDCGEFPESRDDFRYMEMKHRIHSTYMLTLQNIGCESDAQEAGMTRASPQMRLVAKQLHDFERPASASAGADNANPFPAMERLRQNFALLMGPVGCRALIARSIKLASAEVQWLATLPIGDDGELNSLPPALATVSAAEILDGEVVLLSQFIGLLVAFIGPALTLRLFRQLWPQVAFDPADLSSDNTHEKD